MKAAVLYAPGSTENFIIEERDLPIPIPGWIRVEVKAFGLNRSEVMTRKGLSPNVTFPRILGIECVGVVDWDPENILKPGQKVAACMGGMGRDYDGSYAEYVVLPRHIVFPIQSALPWEQIGSIPEMFQTVFGSLDLGLSVKENETLLIRGGTSSIGLLAIQLAKHKKLHVIATTRSAENFSMLHNYGADKVIIDTGHISRDIKNMYPSGVNKVLELVGTETLKDSLACVQPGGTVCMTGMLAEKWSLFDFAPMEFIPATVNLTCYDSGQILVTSNSLQDFIDQVENGIIKLPLSRTFNLENIHLAHELMESNQAKGKIVIFPNCQSPNFQTRL